MTTIPASTEARRPSPRPRPNATDATATYSYYVVFVDRHGDHRTTGYDIDRPIACMDDVTAMRKAIQKEYRTGEIAILNWIPLSGPRPAPRSRDV